jgi:hypothetical protein
VAPAVFAAGVFQPQDKPHRRASFAEGHFIPAIYGTTLSARLDNPALEALKKTWKGSE